MRPPTTASAYSGETAQVSVTVTDNDTADLVVNPSSLPVGEGGTNTFTVKLATQPSGNVSVTVESDDTGAATVNRLSLSFTTSTWNTAQTVIVTGVHDDDIANETPTITATASSADSGYDGETAQVDVTVTDDDTVELIVDPSSLPVDEGGTDTFTVRLATQPTADVSVTVVSNDTGAATVPSDPLTFTAMTWSTAQSVTVTGVEDDDAVNETPTVTATATSTDSAYDGETAEVNVTVTDDETVGLVVDPSSLPVVEGNTGDFTVRLGSQPTANVEVTVESNDTGAATVPSDTLTFTTSDWSTPQTVTVTGVEDDDAIDDVVIVTATASSSDSDYDAKTARVTVNLDDDETPGLRAEPGPLTVQENGTATFELDLDTQPSADVSITIASDDETAVAVPRPIVTFTPENWATSQAVKISGLDDPDADNESVILVLVATGADYGGKTATKEVVTVDDDTAQLLYDPVPLEVVEGETAGLTVRLATQPNASVTVALVLGDTDVATMEQSSLVFTPSDWHAAQTVIVTGVEDDDAWVESTTLTLTAASDDANYEGKMEVVDVNVIEDDIPAIIVNPDTVIVPEGGERTFTVVLSTRPKEEVSVIPGVLGTTDALDFLHQGRIVFTDADWDTPQQYRVRAEQDDNAFSETLITEGFALSVDSDYGGLLFRVDFLAIDNDTAELVVDQSTLMVAEGGMGSFTVRLATEPLHDVTVTASSGDIGAVSVLTGTLTFTADTWDTPQQIMVRGVNDDDARDEVVDVTLLAASADQDYSGAGITVEVTATDDDTAELIVSAVSLPLTEGGVDTFEVRLATEPREDVSVTVTSDDTDAVTLQDTTLTFTASTWHAAQTVTVTAVEDDDAIDNMVTLTATAASTDSDYDDETAEVTVNVTDNDIAGLLVDPVSLSVAEGATATFTMKLATQPSADVSVTVASDDPGAATVLTDMLTFTTSNWNTAQTVTVTAEADDDASNETPTITTTASSSASDYDGLIAQVPVSVVDDDTAALVVSPAGLPLDEGGMDTFDVRLASRPSATVSVSVVSDDPGAATVPADTLTFTTSDWNTAQTVTVTAVQDDDIADETPTVTVTASSSDSDYDGETAQVDVSVTDDDTAEIVLDPSTLPVTEGATSTFTVKLATQPSADVSVTVESDDTSSVTVPSSTFTFSTSTWNTAQTVTVTGVEDADSVGETPTVTATATSSGDSAYNSKTAQVSVTVTDNDTAGLIVAPSPLAVNEGGAATFTVKLATQPTAAVSVTVESNDTTSVTVPSSTFTFTTSTWSTAQTVTVTGVEDDDAANETSTVTATAASSDADYQAETAQVTVNVTDNDTAEIVVDPLSLPVAEGGTATFTAKLASRPSAAVTVTFASDDITSVTVPPDTLTFTDSTWDTAQTVTVTGVEDDDANAETVTVTATASSTDSDYGGLTVEVTVNVTDDDQAALVVNPASLPLAEGETTTFTVKLTSQPIDIVTVTVASDDPEAATVNRLSLSFTASTWNTAQTVTVTGAQDDDISNEMVTVTATATSTDPDYEGKSDELTINITDDDTAGLVVDPSSLPVTEGSTNTFTVQLETQPLHTVTISVESSDNGKAEVSAGGGLTFTPENWDHPQPVTISGTHDDDAAGETATVTATAESDDSDYGGLTAQVAVNVTDDDTPGLSVDRPSLIVAEGRTDSFGIRLATLPTADVTVTVTSGDSGAATVPADTLTFTTSNWNTAQTVTVTAVQDADGVNQTVTVTAAAASADSDYQAVEIEVIVTVTDDDPPGIVVNPGVFPVAEGDTASFDIRLATQPNASVTVEMTSGDTGAVTVPSDTLTFTTSDWDTAQTVTVTAVQDADASNDTVTVTASASSSDMGYSGATAEVTVNVADDETAELIVTPVSLPVQEGGTDTFDVKLATQPIADVTVTVASDDPGAATVAPTPLTFTTLNWSTAQTVTVTALDDDDSYEEDVTVTVTASSSTDSDYDGLSDEVDVSITDDDTAALVVTPVHVPILEGQTGTFEVSLATQPRRDVVVSLRSDYEEILTVSDERLTFTESNWSVAQQVTLTSMNDTNAVNDSVAVTVRVIGHDAAFRGLSKQVSVLITDRDRVPGPPSAITPVHEAGTYIRLAIGLPDNDARATSFAIQWREQPAGDWTSDTIEWPADATEGPTVNLVGLSLATLYLFRARASNAEGDGSWLEKEVVTDDCESSGVTFCSLALTENVEGRIGPKIGIVDHDWYRVTLPSLPAGSQYRIEVRGDVTNDYGGTLADPALSVYTNFSRPISGATDNDSGSGKNAMLLFTPAVTPTDTDTHYIGVFSNDGGLGTYSVSVEIERSPEFTSQKDITLVENSDLNTRVTANDNDVEDYILGFEVTGGADAHLFEIDNMGNLTMTITPDADLPVDLNGDNVYEVELTVSSGFSETHVMDGSATALFTVDVQNLPDEPPPAPLGLHVRNEYTDSIEIEWSPPPGQKQPLASYTVEARVAASQAPVQTDGATTTSLEVDSLDPGIEYEFRVRGVNDDGQGDWTDWITGYTDECGDDRNSACTPDLDSDVVHRVNQRSSIAQRDVDWYEVTREPLADGFFDAYNVTVKGDEAADPGGTLRDPALDVYDDTGMIIALASDGADDGGLGRNAETLVVIHGASPSFYLEVSAQPDGGTITTSAIGSFTLRIEKHTGPVVLNETDFEQNEHTQFTHQVMLSDPDTDDTVTITGIADLDDGALFSIDSAGNVSLNFDPDFERPMDDDTNNVYEFWVEFTNYDSQLGLALRSRFRFLLTILDVDPELPGKPEGVLITDESATSVTIDRGEARPLGSDITSYDVRIAQDRDDGLSLVWTTTDLGMAATHTFSSLAPNTTYHIETRAINDDGAGPWSETLLAVTDDCGNTVSSNVCALPADGIATGRIGAGGDLDVFSVAMQENHLYRVSVKGNNPLALGGTLDNPKLRILNADGTPISGAQDDDGGEGMNAQYDYEPSSSGTYHVEVSDSAGTETGTYTLEVSVHDAPPLISGVTAVAILENTALEHQLDAMDADAQDSIKSVVVSGGADMAVFSVDSNHVLSMTFVPDFENPASANGDNIYEVEITVTSGSDRGLPDRSSVYSFTISIADSIAEVPSRASHNTVEEALDSFTIDWSAPGDNGVAITSYEVRIAPFTGSTWTTQTVSSTARSHTFTGLASGTRYKTQVRAINANGAGVWSPLIEGRTDDCAAGAIFACLVYLDTETAGWINVTNGDSDKDWWGVILPVGRYRFTVESNSDVDPKIKLFADDEVEIPGAEDDDSGTGTGAQLEYQTDRYTIYYIQVTESQGDDTGEYRVTVTEVT